MWKDFHQNKANVLQDREIYDVHPCIFQPEILQAGAVRGLRFLPGLDDARWKVNGQRGQQ